MQNSLKFAWFLAVALMVSACASSKGLPGGEAVPPPSQAPSGDETTGAATGTSVRTGAASTPVSPEAAQAKRKSDTEACYSYALANVRNEARLDDDIAAGRRSRNSQNGRYTVLTRPVNNYYYQRQQERLFENCMQQRGYVNE